MACAHRRCPLVRPGSWSSARVPVDGWRAGGVKARRCRGPSGPGPRLSDQQLAEVAQTLPKGATRPTVHNHGQTPTVEADCLWRLSSSAPVEASTLDGVVGRGKTWVVADSETAPQTGYAPVNGLQMYYELHGSGGIPLLLLHGGLFNIDLQFGQLMPGLAATRKVIAADFQGHGPLTSADLASDVVGLLGHLDIAQADVFGFSVGGAVALHLAINHPELVRKLIVSSASFHPDGGRQENKEAMEALTVDAVAGTPMEQDYRAKSPNLDKLQELLDKLGRFDAGFTGWAEADIRRNRRTDVAHRWGLRRRPAGAHGPVSTAAWWRRQRRLRRGPGLATGGVSGNHPLLRARQDRARPGRGAALPGCRPYLRVDHDGCSALAGSPPAHPTPWLW
jgi:pimeloyl-ACP methyl ester carboxylesterase